jgi:lysophospholipase L1-like esterase
MTTTRTVFAVGALTLAATSSAVPPQLQVGVVPEPCAQVPTEPTALHHAAADPYRVWMDEWLARDWGQRCRYERENAALPPASARRAVLIGDSITEAWRVADPDMFNGDILNRGISGQTSAQLLVRFRADVIDLHPAVVHIMVGTNDIAGNTGPTSLKAIQGNIMSMVEQAHLHGIQVVLASIPPATGFGWRPEVHPIAAISAMETWVRGYAQCEHLVFVDYYAALVDSQLGLKSALSPDGVHPNAAGYAVMRPLLLAALQKARALNARDQRSRCEQIADHPPAACAGRSCSAAVVARLFADQLQREGASHEAVGLSCRALGDGSVDGPAVR